MNKLLRVAIVGPQEDQWTEEQKENAKFWIKHILYCMKISNKCTVPLNRDTIKVIDNDSKNLIHQITLVSGHCPKGGVDIWAEEIADSLGIKKLIFTPEVNQWSDQHYNYYNPLGIDREEVIGCAPAKRIGYKSRNIKIAEECDVLYCIVPSNGVYSTKTYGVDNIALSTEGNIPYCRHCKVLGHITNGGCWTLKYCKSLNKETHLVVIE